MIVTGPSSTRSPGQQPRTTAQQLECTAAEAEPVYSRAVFQ